MAVIINELEVVIEQPKASAPAGAPAATVPPMPSPQDLGDINERRVRLSARVFAH